MSRGAGNFTIMQSLWCMEIILTLDPLKLKVLILSGEGGGGNYQLLADVCRPGTKFPSLVLAGALKMRPGRRQFSTDRDHGARRQSQVSPCKQKI